MSIGEMLGSEVGSLLFLEIDRVLTSAFATLVTRALGNSKCSILCVSICLSTDAGILLLEGPAEEASASPSWTIEVSWPLASTGAAFLRGMTGEG